MPVPRRRPQHGLYARVAEGQPPLALGHTHGRHRQPFSGFLDPRQRTARLGGVVLARLLVGQLDDAAVVADRQPHMPRLDHRRGLGSNGEPRSKQNQ